MCEHLEKLDREIKYSGIKELSRGQPWSQNCREWVYYDCFLEIDSIKKRFSLPNCIVYHSNDDPKSGLEAGLVCEKCHDAVMGVHSSMSGGRKVFN